MFWDSGYSNSANIDALLNKENCTLKELLEDEDILQECKSQNQKLCKFLTRSDIVEELITLITTEPSTDTPEEKRFLLPNVACEIVTSDVPSLKQRLAEDHNIMNKLYGFFEQEPPLNPLLASFVCKTFSSLITKKIEQDWFLYQTICLHVLEFIKSKDNFLDAMTRHVAIPVVIDLLLNMLNDVEDEKMKSSFLEWINEKGLIGKMISVLQVPCESDKHSSVAQFLTEVVKIGRCNRQNDTEDRKTLPNPLLHTLEDKSTVSQLLDVILSESRCESSILSGFQVLLCLLENPIIQEPVSQTALQQMIDAEKEHHDEIVASLMVVVQPRVHQLFELLLNPPSKLGPFSDHHLTAPLGNVRLQLCFLFTVLLETENTSIIEEICKTNFFVELLKLFKQYCWNNFLHTYVKKCLVYGLQAFDTIPNSTQLVISALQNHIVVNCKVADKLVDCWNENERSQASGGRRMGYMGHLIDILGAVESTQSASDEFRALIESSLSTNTDGIGEPASEISSTDVWRQILEANAEEIIKQNRLLADCDPSKRQEEGRDGMASFPPLPAEFETDNEDFDYQLNSSMHGTVNGMGDFDDFTNDDDFEAQNKMFNETCNQTISTFSMDTNFADWNNADAISSNHNYSFDFNNSLSLKSSASPFGNDDDEQEQNDDDPFPSSSDGFNSIIGNNNISNHQFYHHNGAYDQNDFLMNFYVSPITITNTNYPLSATNNYPSYNPFHYHHEIHDADADVNSNNDNWANFDSDNFADFDSHFANITPAGQTTESVDDDNPSTEQAPEPCFIATTQTIEISNAPPEPVKRDFVLGAPIGAKEAVDEVEDDEFFSLRDDSNEMSSLTEDGERKMLENTEAPDDEDPWESADESSSKGNSEEETGADLFVDCTVSPPPDAKNEDQSLDGVDFDLNAVTLNDASEDLNDPDPISAVESSKVTEKLAQAPESELITPVVPFENGSA